MEMTGLDPERDRVLELAAIATDWNLEEIATWTAAVKQAGAEELMRGEFWDKNKSLRETLLAESAAGKSEREVEKELVEFVKEYFVLDRSRPIYIAGNSVHQDRKFLERYLPEVDKMFHYRLLDVSAWKIMFMHKYRQKVQKPETHRALDDIKGSIEELRTYLERAEQGIKANEKKGE